jgi:hypothetical protein
VNVFSDAACAVIVARLEGEQQVLKGDDVALAAAGAPQRSPQSPGG